MAQQSVRLEDSIMALLKKRLQALGYPERGGLNQFLEDIATDKRHTIAPTPELLKALLSAVQMNDLSIAQPLARLGKQLSSNQSVAAEFDRLQRTSRWVVDAQKCCNQQQPFVLRFKEKDRTCIFGQFQAWNGREYLYAYTQEENPKAEIQALSHNRMFWIGGDDDATVTPMEGIWKQDGLDSIEVTYRVRFRHRLSPEDISVEPVMIDGEPWTAVTRRVSQFLPFIQKILGYGDKAVIMQPTEMQEKLIDLLRETLNQYV